MRYVREPDAITVALKGNNTYQIVYTGNSGIAMDGAAQCHIKIETAFN